MQHPRCELTPGGLSVCCRGRNRGKIPASICGACGIDAEATPTSWKALSRPYPQVPLLTCLRGATRISTGCTGVTASRRSPNDPRDAESLRECRARRTTEARRRTPAPGPTGYGTAQPRPGPPPPGPPRGPGGSGRPMAPQPARPAKRRHPVRNFFRVLLILLLLVFILWLVAVPAYAWTQVARVDAAPSGQRPADQPGKTFLLVGSDSRAGLSKAEQKRLGTGSAGGQRTDTIMLVYVPPGGKSALISIPVTPTSTFQGTARTRSTPRTRSAALSCWCRRSSRTPAFASTAIWRSGLAASSTSSTRSDGIRMCLPNAIKDRDSHLDLPKGCQTLSGAEASRLRTDAQGRSPW